MSDNRIRKAFQNDFHIPDEIFWSDKQNIYISTKAREGAFQCAGIHNTALASYTKGFQAAETPLLARIAELEGQMANREPFVVRLPCVIKAAEKYAENYDDDDRECIKTDVINAFYAGTKFCKAAITAAGGRCV